MMNYIELLIGTIILCFGIYYVSYKIFYGKKFFALFNVTIVLLCAIIMTILSIIAYNSIFRVICNALLITAINQLIFKEKALKTVIGSFMTIGIITISEGLWVTIVVMLSKLNMEQLKVQYFLHLWANMGITFLMIAIIQIKIILNKARNLIGALCIEKKMGVFICIFFSVICLFLLFYYIYFQQKPINALIICLILTVCYTSLPLILFKEKNDKFKLQVEHNMTVQNLNSSEKKLDDQRMKNHENSNNLTAIRGMINPENREAIEFIDSLSEGRRDENKTIAEKVNVIPYGNLRELMYQKITWMDQEKYHYNVEISKEIKQLNTISIKNMKDVCTIVGVLLDNAIQAAQTSKKKQIGIYVYKKQDYFIIQISNNFSGNLEIDKLEKKGYTTKGKGHGYGLSLVKEIIESNENITNEKTFNGDIFSQIIKIKTK